MTRERITFRMTPLEFRAREAINTLRGNIQMAGYDVSVIGVTSARANEGKSSMAFRLAVSLAALGKRTLYLDCDIRNSKVKKRYHIIEKTVGLSDYLCGKLTLEELIYPTNDADLDMVFSGSFAPNPSELLSGKLFSELIAAVKKQYDYVVVDTPPVNIVIHAAIIAKQCDTTILVVESAGTDRRDAIRAREQLEYAGAKILGVVLNRISPNGTYGAYRKYGYGRYGRYGYGYGAYAKEVQENGDTTEMQEGKTE